jgi:DNA-binding transcriptional LysR family regulator
MLVSQPAVSRQLKQLERALGARLFERVPRGVRPTEAGALLAGYARRILALAAEAEQALGDLRGLRRGRLAVGAGTMLGVYLLPDVLVRFRDRFPGVQVRLDIEESGQLRRRLEEGALDLGVTEGPIDAPHLAATVLMREPMAAIAPPDHPLTRRGRGPRRVSLKELCREPFVVREASGGGPSYPERLLAERGHTVRPVLSLASTEAIKRAVAAGLGVAIVSRLAIELEVMAGRLVEVPLAGPPIDRPVHLVRPHASHASAATEAFVAMLSEAVRPAPPQPDRPRSAGRRDV